MASTSNSKVSGFRRPRNIVLEALALLIIVVSALAALVGGPEQPTASNSLGALQASGAAGTSTSAPSIGGGTGDVQSGDGTAGGGPTNTSTGTAFSNTSSGSGNTNPPNVSGPKPPSGSGALNIQPRVIPAVQHINPLVRRGGGSETSACPSEVSLQEPLNTYYIDIAGNGNDAYQIGISAFKCPVDHPAALSGSGTVPVAVQATYCSGTAGFGSANHFFSTFSSGFSIHAATQSWTEYPDPDQSAMDTSLFSQTTPIAGDCYLGWVTFVIPSNQQSIEVQFQDPVGNWDSINTGVFSD